MISIIVIGDALVLFVSDRESRQIIAGSKVPLSRHVHHDLDINSYNHTA